MNKRGPKAKTAEPKKWSRDLAYCIGLLATDGCLYNDGRHIDFTSADLESIETFKRILKLSNKICHKTNKTSGKKCPRIQFGDVRFYRWLLSIGLTPKKSLTLGPLKIPRKFFIDFVRGCFDGDGTIYSYLDPRWKNSYMFYVEFASGSKNFIAWLRKQLRLSIGISGHVIAVKNYYMLKFAKTESLVLIEKMYYNQRVPCLQRKRKKIITILKKHRKIQSKNSRVFLNKIKGFVI